MSVINKRQIVHCIVTLQQERLQPDDGQYRDRNM